MKFQIASLSIFLSTLVSQATADMEIVEFDKWKSLSVCEGIGIQAPAGQYTDGVVSVSSITMFDAPFFTVTNFCNETQVDFYLGEGTFWNAFRHGVLPPVQLATCVLEARPTGHGEQADVVGGSGVGYTPKLACVGILCL
jgi:hypothetical protein